MVALLGYDYDAFRLRMESTFTDGMTWGRFLAGDVHIDHIIPLASFCPTDRAAIKEAWSLTNIRALWPHDNLAKLRLDRQSLAAREGDRV